MPTGPAPVPAHGRTDWVGETAVHTITTTPDDAPHPDVVLLPGLGIPDYLGRVAHVLTGLGLSCTVLDLPGFGHRTRTGGSLSCPPDVVRVGALAARWLDLHCAGGERRLTGRAPVVLVGHSTAAQAALHASAQCEAETLGALILAGPTVAPRQRAVRRLAAVTPGAYRSDSWRQAPLLRYVARYAPELLHLTRTGVADLPEVTIGQVRVPVMLTAGRDDAYCTLGWLGLLARSAVRSSSVRVVRLPGSHNTPYTYPRAFGALLAAVTLGAQTTTGKVTASTLGAVAQPVRASDS